MINGLKVLFGGILAVMLYVTVTASLDRGVFAAGSAGLDPDLDGPVRRIRNLSSTT